MISTFELRKLPVPPEDSVVSIGVFDGVHLGHQAILSANTLRARALGAIPTVVTFRRHPKKVLLGRAPRTLTTLEHRLELFRRAGIGHAVALNFDDSLRQISAETFAQQVLLEGLGVRQLVLGFDSKFGRDRRGTPELLESLGFDVEVVPKVQVGERAVSSTAIREAVELGDLVAAATMLGRPVAVFGRVVHGDARGRQIGFPTANLHLRHELHPPIGVYACQAHRVGAAGDGAREESWDAVANIGYRPTVDQERPAEPRVEVHLLDFEGDLYGEHMELEFVARIRGEQKFEDLEGLRCQIGEDVTTARGILAQAEREDGSDPAKPKPAPRPLSEC